MGFGLSGEIFIFGVLRVVLIFIGLLMCFETLLKAIDRAGSSDEEDATQ
jgi:hypothetical protein